MISFERIQSQNAIHRSANSLEADLLKLLQPWLNKKIVTLKKDKVAKWAKEFDSFIASRECSNSGSDIWINLYVSYNSLILSVRNIKSALKVELYIGRCDDFGILTRLMDQSLLRTDFTLEEVESAFKTARELEDKARVLLSSVSVFRR